MHLISTSPGRSLLSTLAVLLGAGLAVAGCGQGALPPGPTLLVDGAVADASDPVDGAAADSRPAGDGPAPVLDGGPASDGGPGLDGPLPPPDAPGPPPDAPLPDGALPDAPPPGPDAPSGTCATPAPPAAFTGINDRPGFLQVQVNNIENLEEPGEQECPGDWRLLFHEMAEGPLPDVFLVQQVSGRVQLDVITAHMTDRLGSEYRGIVAEANPDAMNSPCGPPKDFQTNAIIYRTARLSPVGSKHVWQSFANIQDACRRNVQARTMNVMHKFHDLVADRDVTVASLHWATNQGGGPDPACAEANVQEVAAKLQLAAYRADLLIFGGDMNETDRAASGSFRPWYRQGNADLGGQLGFRDPVFARCDAGASRATCLDDNWSIGQDKRIDFLFARQGDGCLPVTGNAKTITFNEAAAAGQRATGQSTTLNYSDHRSVRAAIRY